MLSGMEVGWNYLVQQYKLGTNWLECSSAKKKKKMYPVSGVWVSDGQQAEYE